MPGYAGSLSAALPGAGAAAWERLGAELVLSALVTGAYFAAMERRWTGAAPALVGAAYCAASLVSVSAFYSSVAKLQKTEPLKICQVYLSVCQSVFHSHFSNWTQVFAGHGASKIKLTAARRVD